jgi:hypothetical protein
MTYIRVFSLISCLLVMVAVVWVWRVWRETGVYDASKGVFVVSDLAIHLPESIRDAILSIESQAVRRTVPFGRQGASLSQTILDNRIPEIREYHQSLVPLVSKLVGRRVSTCPSVSGTSRTVLVYDHCGDYIDWHYDTDAQTHPSSRFFTLLIPVETRSACMTFRVKMSHDTESTMELPVLFEGPTTFHSATPMCRGERRLVLALTFCTHPDSVDTNSLMHRLKQQSFS